MRGDRPKGRTSDFVGLGTRLSEPFTGRASHPPLVDMTTLKKESFTKFRN